MNNIQKIWSWLDQNFFTLLVGSLIIIIPLYPKIPLAELLEGYNVRLRLDDLLVLAAFVLWLVEILRGRAKLPRNQVAKWIYIYLGVGFLSTLSALVITDTVPLLKDHVFKLFFHLIRRIEYFSLFFVTYAAIKNKNHLRLFTITAAGTLFGVILYGIGQKYFYLPAFSTMNREFSKGVMLFLQPNTRLFSTFGGHYDLAAYLMMLLGFSFPAAWLVKQTWLKIVLYALSVLTLWALVLTTSRTSFIGYLVAITFAAFFLIKYKGLWWSFKRWVLVGLTSLVIMFFFSNLLERFTQVIPNPETRATILALQDAANQPFVNQPDSSRRISEIPNLLAMLFKQEAPTPIPLEEIPEDQLALVGSPSDTPPTPAKPTPQPELPSDVDPESEEYRQAVAEQKGEADKPGEYSPNALKYGLSMGIRLDVLWPNAINGFKTNPLLGTGYSTLVKTNNHEFTYAESTDNDYLRMLGETGALGFVSFVAIIVSVFVLAKKSFTNNNFLTDVIALGTMASILALAVNALYIDVFESSKVAYTFWFLAALAVRNWELLTVKKRAK